PRRWRGTREAPGNERRRSPRSALRDRGRNQRKPMSTVDRERAAPSAEGAEPDDARFQLNLMSFKRQLPDGDPVETREWIEALDDVYRTQGRERADFLLRKV